MYLKYLKLTSMEKYIPTDFIMKEKTNTLLKLN